MKGLILKDFLNLKKQVMPLVLFLAVYLVISIISKNGAFFIGVAMVFSAMLPISSISYDERAGFTKYALTLPVSRNALVLSKYIFAFMLIAVAAAACFLVNFFIGDSLLENIFSIVTLSTMGILLVSFSLPPILKFGSEKGRFVMVAIFLFSGFVILVCKGVLSSLEDSSTFAIIFATQAGLESLLLSNWFILSVIASGFGVFLLSFAISLRIYKNKDF